LIALKGLDNGWDDEPAVRLAITEAGPDPVAIVAEASWPPGDLVERKLQLDARSGAMTEAGAPLDAASVGFDAARGVVAFTWIIPEALDVIGPMALLLHVEMKGAEDVLLFAGARKIRSGIEITFEGSYGFSGDMVSKEWQRAAHRELDAGKRNHATRFRKGDELRLEIRGHWFFPDDPLRGQFPANYQASPAGFCLLHTGRDASSYLLMGTRSAA
jgi:predicted acyl esterase